jgi:hypothetical protein
MRLEVRLRLACESVGVAFLASPIRDARPTGAAMAALRARYARPALQLETTPGLGTPPT